MSAFFLDGLHSGLDERFGGRHHLALIDDVAVADERYRDMRKRAEVAARADGALGRDDGMDAEVEVVDHLLERLEADAGVAAGERVDAEQHYRADYVLGIGLAEAAGVAQKKVLLELAAFVARDDDGGEVAEARRYAVDDAAFVGPREDRLGAFLYLFLRFGGDFNLPALARDVHDVLKSE